MEEESEFSRLIAQSHTLEEHILGFQRLIPEELSQSLNLEAPDGTRTRVIIDDKPRGPHMTALAGTLCLLHLGLVWGSYTADAWSETHINVKIGWQMKYLPLLDQVQDQVIRTTSLASFLQDLDECRSYFLLILIWTTALVIPCLFMVLSPTLVVGDYIRPLELQKRRVAIDGRSCMELLTRFSWLPIFSLSIISLATAFVDLELTDTVIRAGLQTRNPYAAYTVGTICAVSLLMLLRFPRQESFRLVSDSELEIEFPSAAPTPTIRSPPPQAFQHPWHVDDPTNNNLSDHDEPIMTVLEEDVLRTPPRPAARLPTSTNAPYIRPPAPSEGTPELIDEDPMRPPSPPKLTYWNKFTVFQLGLLSVIFWIPTYYLPLLHFSYRGVASAFLKQQSFQLYLWELPSYLWAQEVEFKTPVWIVVVLAIFLITTVLLLPLVATFQGVLAWLGEGGWRTRSYVWLYTLHPCLGGLVFSLALVSTIPSLSPLSALMLDERAGDMCHYFSTNNRCLDVKAQLLSGAFFYVAQAACLEAFVLLTLRWSRRH